MARFRYYLNIYIIWQKHTMIVVLWQCTACFSICTVGICTVPLFGCVMSCCVQHMCCQNDSFWSCLFFVYLHAFSEVAVCWALLDKLEWPDDGPFKGSPKSWEFILYEFGWITGANESMLLRCFCLDDKCQSCCKTKAKDSSWLYNIWWHILF